MKIVSVIGARPQFVKAAVVSRAMRAAPEFLDIVVHTGQHYDENMSGIFFDELGIPPPQYNLGIGSGPHGLQTGRMLAGIESTLQEIRPDFVLVYGDTNSTLAGALAAAKLHLPVAHVEAGLRSYNRRMPEETNRVVADHVSDLLFVPTAAAVANLAHEGIPAHKIWHVGDVMYDAALFYASDSAKTSDLLQRYGLRRGKYVLATVHRAENTDDPVRLRNIIEGLSQTARDCLVLFPVHPRTRKILSEMQMQVADGVRLINPVGYVDMVVLEKNARVVATDSGGVQKEAYFFHVPCVTLRDETEWTELVDMGWNRLVPPINAELISGALLTAAPPSARNGKSPYGDGHAAEKICQILLSTMTGARTKSIGS
jgi:UDP-GlcNAc3NAcA epimerase